MSPQPARSGLTLRLGLSHTPWRVVAFEADACTIAGAATTAGQHETVTLQAGPCISITVPARAEAAIGAHQRFVLLPPDPDILPLIQTLFEQGGTIVEAGGAARLDVDGSVNAFW